MDGIGTDLPVEPGGKEMRQNTVLRYVFKGIGVERLMKKRSEHR